MLTKTFEFEYANPRHPTIIIFDDTDEFSFWFNVDGFTGPPIVLEARHWLNDHWHIYMSHTTGGYKKCFDNVDAEENFARAILEVGAVVRFLKTKLNEEKVKEIKLEMSKK